MRHVVWSKGTCTVKYVTIFCPHARWKPLFIAAPIPHEIHSASANEARATVPRARKRVDKLSKIDLWQHTAGAAGAAAASAAAAIF